MTTGDTFAVFEPPIPAIRYSGMANSVFTPDRIAPSPRPVESTDSTPVVEAHFEKLGRTGYWDSLYGNIADPAVRWSFIRRQSILEALLTPIVHSDTRVVEIGPGTGNLVGFFASRGCHYRAFDAAPAMVEATNVAIERHAGLFSGSRCERADIHALPLGDGCADVVVAAGVVEYLDDPARAMRELARITRRQALITLPNARSLNRLLSSKLGFVTQIAKRIRSRSVENPVKPDVRRTAYTPTRFAADIAGPDWRLDGAHYYDVEAILYPLNRVAPRVAFAAKRAAESSSVIPKSILANGVVLSLTRVA